MPACRTSEGGQCGARPSSATSTALSRRGHATSGLHTRAPLSTRSRFIPFCSTSCTSSSSLSALTSVNPDLLYAIVLLTWRYSPAGVLGTSLFTVTGRNRRRTSSDPSAPSRRRRPDAPAHPGPSDDGFTPATGAPCGGTRVRPRRPRRRRRSPRPRGHEPRRVPQSAAGAAFSRHPPQGTSGTGGPARHKGQTSLEAVQDGGHPRSCPARAVSPAAATHNEIALIMQNAALCKMHRKPPPRRTPM